MVEGPLLRDVLFGLKGSISILNLKTNLKISISKFLAFLLQPKDDFPKVRKSILNVPKTLSGTVIFFKSRFYVSAAPFSEISISINKKKRQVKKVRRQMYHFRNVATGCFVSSYTENNIFNKSGHLPHYLVA